jgi:cellulose synthase operon protein C
MNKLRAGLCVLTVFLILAGCAGSPQGRRDRYLARGKQYLDKGDSARAILEFKNAASAVNNDAEVFYQLGLAYLQARDLRGAFASFQKAVSLNPGHTGAQLRIGQLESSTDDRQDLSDARKRLENVLRGTPNDPDALHALALTELKLGDQQQGLQNLELAAALAPRQLLIAATLAEARLELKDFKGAEEILEKAAAASPNSASAALILGRLFALENRPKEAEQQYRRALALDPKFGPALLNLAVLQLVAGQKQDAEVTLKKISNLADSEVNYSYAGYLFQEGRQDEAVRELERLHKQNPEDRAARTRLVAIYQATNRVPEAKSLLNTTLKADPRDLDALLQRGELSLAGGNLPAASTDLNAVVRLKPDSPELRYALSKLHEARHAIESQRQELNEALRLNPALLPARLDLARSLTTASAAKSAVSLLDQAPPAQQKLLPVIEARGWALIYAGDAAAARRSIDEGLRTSRTADLLLQDAVLKSAQRDFAGARADAAEILGKVPGEPRALNLVARTYVQQGQMATAVAEVRRYAALAPKSAAAQQVLGQLLDLSKKPEEARSVFAAARTLDPNFTEADIALAQLDANAGQTNVARQRLQGVLSTHPDMLRAQLLLAQIDMESRNFPAATDRYLSLAQQYSDNTLILNNLAYSLVEAGRYDEALKYAEKAKELAPDRPDVDDTIGWAMYHKSAYPTAIQYLQKSVSREDVALTNYHLAMAYSKAGNAKKAKETLEKALKQNPNLPEAGVARNFVAVVPAGSGK